MNKIIYLITIIGLVINPIIATDSNSDNGKSQPIVIKVVEDHDKNECSPLLIIEIISGIMGGLPIVALSIAKIISFFKDSGKSALMLTDGFKLIVQANRKIKHANNKLEQAATDKEKEFWKDALEDAQELKDTGLARIASSGKNFGSSLDATLNAMGNLEVEHLDHTLNSLARLTKDKKIKSALNKTAKTLEEVKRAGSTGKEYLKFVREFDDLQNAIKRLPSDANKLANDPETAAELKGYLKRLADGIENSSFEFPAGENPFTPPKIPQINWQELIKQKSQFVSEVNKLPFDTIEDLIKENFGNQGYEDILKQEYIKINDLVFKVDPAASAPLEKFTLVDNPENLDIAGLKGITDEQFESFLKKMDFV